MGWRTKDGKNVRNASKALTMLPLAPKASSSS